MLAEFDLGYVIWTRQPATILPVRATARVRDRP